MHNDNNIDKKIDVSNDPDYREFMSAIEDVDDPILLTLRVHLYTEHLLERIIIANLPKGYRAIDKGNFTYHQKLMLVDSLDCVADDIIQSLMNLNSIRNTLSHELKSKISLSDIDKIGRPFGKNYRNFRQKHHDNHVNLLATTFGCIIGRLSTAVENCEGKN